MKKNNFKKIFILSGLSFILYSCQGEKKFEVVNWNQGDSPALLSKINSIDSQTTQNAKTNSLTIENNIQKYEGFEIENSFIKKTFLNGQLKQASAQFFSPDQIKKKSIKNFNLSLSQNFLELKFLQNSNFSEKIKFIQVKPVLVVNKKEYTPYWRFDYFDHAGIPWSEYLDSDFNSKNKKRIGSQFSDVSALVFPSGPKRSALTDVMLTRLKEMPLENEFISVTSESSSKINSVTQALNFSTDDYRFDQVQVFYYLNRSLSWFKENFQLQSLNSLEAVVHIGYPEKTNSAFYYQGRIRIGAGDGVNYDRIPKDPSIVIHESVHAVIEQVAGLPYEGQGGSLNEAISDYFTAVQLQNANLAEVAFLKGPYKRTLETKTVLSEANEGLYHDSLIISGLLWQLQKEISTEKMNKVVFLTLTKLNLVSDFKDFADKLKQVAAENLSADENKILLSELEQRGFK